MTHEHSESICSDSVMYGIFPPKAGRGGCMCGDEPPGFHHTLKLCRERKIILKRKKEKIKFKEPVKINVVSLCLRGIRTLLLWGF